MSKNANNADIAVKIDGISKRYGAGGKNVVTALDNISLTVPRGAFYGLLGPNGAGKTTLIGALGGLIKPTQGTGAVFGKDIIRDTLAARRLIGIVPQEPVYDPFFKVRESLVFQSKYYGIFNNGGWIDTLLENLHLTDKVNTNTRALSGGMKRRLMIAQALVHKPPVIVLDEPTAGVDIDLRLSLWEFIRSLNRDGHTIILTTHYLEEAETLCDSVALINHGKIAAVGKTRDLLLTAPHAARVHIRAYPAGNPGATLPATLPAPTETDESGARVYEVKNCDHIEPLLAAYRQAGVTIEELSVTPPSLEEMFVEIIRQNNRQRKSAQNAAAS